ncbi:MAG: hypothetical protein ACLQJ0_16200 [Steroidobacteraceae bacterium]|jgi:hypothetical protein
MSAAGRAEARASTLGRSDGKRLDFMIFIAWLGVGFAYALYSWLTYTGPFRWMADLELRIFGAYLGKLTLYAITLMLWGLPLVVLFPVDWVLRRLGHPSAALTALFYSAPRDAAPVTRASQHRRGLTKTGARVLLFTGVVAMLVSASVALVGYRKSQEGFPFELLNLTDGVPSRSSHVELTGIALPAIQMQVKESTLTTTYTPLVPRHWHQGDPIVYFLRSSGEFYAEGQQPFAIQQRGVLNHGDLPRPVANLYEKRNIKLDAQPVVLDPHHDADLMPYWLTAGTIGILGTFLLLILLFSHAVNIARKRIRSIEI